MSIRIDLNRRRWLAAVLLLPVANAWATPGRPRVEVWKDPSCGCCKDWMAQMEKNGFDVQVYEIGNAAMRAQLGIPLKFGSCHTARVGGYAIEGHVPAREIQRLLKEKPKAVGLAVPGMAIGAPGMDGPEYGNRKDPYDVLLIQQDGNSLVYQSYR